MTKKNFLFFTVILFFSIYSTFGVFHSALSFNWTFQDWLINYEGGFVRRGLSGQIIKEASEFFFSDNKQLYFGLQINYVYFYFITFLCLLFYYQFYSFLKKELINIKHWFIIFSPLSIPFILYNYQTIGRKEILLFIIFLSFVFLLKRVEKKETSILFLIISIPLLLLIHEGMFFFISVFFIISLFEVNPSNKKLIYYSLSFLFFLILFFLFLTIIFKGNNSHVEDICTSLSNYPIKDCKKISAIEMLSNKHTLKNEFNVFWIRAFHDKYIPYYIFFSALAFFPLITTLYKYKFHVYLKNRTLNVNSLIIILIIFINAFPLFLFTHDWGRWLNVIYILSLITFFHLKSSNKVYLANNNEIFFYRGRIRKFLLSVLLILYATLNISYFGGYQYMLHTYSTIERYLEFCLKISKTFLHIF